MNVKSLALGSTALVMFGLCHAPAFAAVAPPAGSGVGSGESATISEVVVTAQRREESLQQVPIAESVVSAEALAQRNVNDVRDIVQLVPNLRIDTPYGNAFPKISLRGVGSGAYNQNTESTVAIYMDDLVLNAPAAKLTQLFDTERVEVLRGPQGTLYGKNTTGGAINFVTRRPTGQTEADGSFTVARYGEVAFDVGAETPITDDLSIRAAVKRRYRDGYGFNKLTDEKIYDNDEWAGRVGLRYQHGDTDAYLKLFADRSRQQGFYSVETGVNPDGSPTTTGMNPLTGYIRPANIDVGEYQQQRANVDNRGVTLNVDQRVGDLTFSSVTGYIHTKQDLSQDADGSPIVFVEVDPYSSKVREFSQEFRLSSPAEGPLSWILGATAFSQTVGIDNQAIITGFANTLAGFGVVIPSSFRQEAHERSTSFAAFLDATYKLNDQLKVFAGVRMTSDKKSIHMFPVNGISLIGPYDFKSSKSWTEPTYRAGLNFQANPSTMLYASYNHGYRSGTYDTSFVGTPDQIKGPVNPEFVDSGEVGVKTTLFDRTLQINAATFYTIFRDQQLPVLGALGLCCSLANAGKSRIYGLEAEVVWRVTPDFDMNLDATVADGKYLRFNTGTANLAGQKLGNLADYEVRLSPEYRIPFGSGHFFIAPEALFVGESRRSTAVDPFGQDVQPAYTLLNGQAGYRAAGDRFSVFAFVKNATNKRYITDFASSPGFGFKQVWYAEPMTWGLTATGTF